MKKQRQEAENMDPRDMTAFRELGEAGMAGLGDLEKVKQEDRGKVISSRGWYFTGGLLILFAGAFYFLVISDEPTGPSADEILSETREPVPVSTQTDEVEEVSLEDEQASGSTEQPVQHTAPMEREQPVPSVPDPVKPRPAKAIERHYYPEPVRLLISPNRASARKDLTVPLGTPAYFEQRQPSRTKPESSTPQYDSLLMPMLDFSFRQQWDQAGLAAQELLNYYPGDVNGAYYLAEALYRKGDFRTSERWFKLAEKDGTFAEQAGKRLDELAEYFGRD